MDVSGGNIHIEAKDGLRAVLEFENESFLAGKEEAATKLGIWSERIGVERLDEEEFQQAHFYDMRDPVVCKIFYLEQWTHFFESTEENSQEA